MVCEKQVSDPQNFFGAWWWLFFSSCPVRANFFGGGDERAGVTGKWIGITKEVANNKRLIHCGGTRRRTRMMRNWVTTNKLCKKRSAVLNVWLLAF
jgi:hypothetical protein